MAGIIRQITELPAAGLPEETDLLHVKQGVVDVKMTLKDALSLHADRKDNPHEVTAEQVGLGNCPNLKVSHTYTEGRKTLISSEFAVNHLWLSLKDGLNNSVPTGLICMWSGTISDIPEGWALCDGSNGTPNLKGRFIVGYDAGDSDYNWAGGINGGIGSGKGFTGGSTDIDFGILNASTEDYTLVEEDLPDHRHWIHHTHPTGYTSVNSRSARAEEEIVLTGQTIKFPTRLEPGATSNAEYVELPVGSREVSTRTSHKHNVYVPEYRGYSGWEYGEEIHNGVPGPASGGQASGDSPSVMHEARGHRHGLKLSVGADSDNRPMFYTLAYIIKLNV